MPAIKCENLTKIYGSRAALDGLTLEVPERSIFGFLGPNGAGKTTTIRLLMGMSRPSAGRAWVGGREVVPDAPDMRRRTGYLPDVPNFYNWMTAAEFMQFVGELHQMPPAENRVRAAELLDLVGLSGEKKRIGGYSRGMKQRLGLAQALQNKPDVLFLDEPCSALDPMGRRDVLNLILHLRQTTTVFMSTHILSDVERVCDSLAIVDKGRLLATSSVEELRSRYVRSAFEIELDAAPDALAVSLQGQPWVVTAEKTEFSNRVSGLRVLASDVDEAQRSLPRLIAEAGLGLARLELTMPSLEDIFVKLVSGEKSP